MKTTLTMIVLFMISTIAFGQVNPDYHYVEPYHKSNGTYIQGHYRTNPNNTINDNYSTIPNVNPWTGKKGTIQPDYSDPMPTYPFESPTYPTYDDYTPLYNYVAPSSIYPSYTYPNLDLNSEFLIK